MTSNLAQNNSMSQEDEIGLVQLVKVLWQGKTWIVICSLIFSVIGIVYALTAQQWWTSSAKITKGQYQNTALIRNKLTNVYTIGSDKTIAELNSIISEQELLQAFVSKFNAYNNKVQFVLSNPLMQKYAKENGLQSDEQQRNFAVQWSEKISADIINDKKDVYKLTYQAKSSTDSYQLLQSYIDFINQDVANEVVYDLSAVVDNNKKVLLTRLAFLESRANQKIATEIKKTQYALDIAEAADANSPIPLMDNNQLFAIDLGSKGLKEKESILNKIKDLSMFEPEINVLKLNLQLLDQVNISSAIKLQPVRFLQNADYPMSRDKPNRVGIVLFTLILGAIFGSASVIFRFLWKQEKQNLS